MTPYEQREEMLNPKVKHIEVCITVIGSEARTDWAVDQLKTLAKALNQAHGIKSCMVSAEDFEP